jgi:NitT/TauT family transport system permease protein
MSEREAPYQTPPPAAAIAFDDAGKIDVTNADDTHASRWPAREQVFSFVSPLALLALWEVLSRLGILDRRIFSSPSGVAVLAWQMALDGTLWTNLSATLARFSIGAALGIVPGVLLGLTMGLFRWPRAIINPLVSAIYPLPRIALFPLVLLLVGLNEESNIVMIALQPFFYMLIGTMAAVINVDPIYLRVAQSFKVGTRDLYFLVMFPAALPMIVSSLRLALGGALLVTVTVESLVAQSGIGYMIWHSWAVLSLGQAMVGLVIAGILGFCMIQGLDLIEKRLVPWSGNARLSAP